MSVTFGANESAGIDDAGDARFSRSTGTGRQSLTLFNPARLGGGTASVSLGLWQQRTSDGGLQFDVFTYGFPTKAAEVPHSGSATYDIDLFGVASPLGSFPRSVVGDGTFSLDFAHGVFAMSGEAGEYNNDADYSTCCARWQGAGYLASTGALDGNFRYDGRDGYTYQAVLLGALYGGAGKEVGGTLLGSDGASATFTGGFAGTRKNDGIVSSLSVLDQGERSYYALNGTSVASSRAGSDASNSDAYYWPATFGSIDFSADGSVTPQFRINDPRFENVTFKPTDLVAAQSDKRFAVYEVHNANGDYRLEMFKPGAGNPEINLSYSSFGHWQETRAVGDLQRQSLSTWISYGVRTGNGTLPQSGAAHFNATVLGSGERFADMAQLTVKGTTSIDIDFASAHIVGRFDADAWTSANEKIDLPVMTFEATSNAYAFDTMLMDLRGLSPGSIRGSLYGPGGEEIGGSFDFFTRAFDGGPVDASYAGVFYGKRN